MHDTIPGVKLAPSLVPPICRAFVEYISNPDSLKSKIITLYKEQSVRRRPPSDKNAFRAVTLPSLRHLRLIEGTWPETRPTADMKELVRSYKSGPSDGKRTFGRIVALLDMKGPGILRLIESQGGRVGAEKIASLLVTQFHPESESEFRELRDRLKRWLGFLEHVELVYEDHGISLNSEVLELAVSKKSFAITLQEFSKLLVQEYEHLRSGNPSMIYVPIPTVRDEVCRAKPGMLTDDFYEMLKQARENGVVRMLLSEPMTRQEGGMRLGEKYYYYISIYAQQGNR